jgi:UDP-N-acetylglucosamine transferase subunit ALG13
MARGQDGVDTHQVEEAHALADLAAVIEAADRPNGAWQEAAAAGGG